MYLFAFYQCSWFNSGSSSTLWRIYFFNRHFYLSFYEFINLFVWLDCLSIDSFYRSGLWMSCSVAVLRWMAFFQERPVQKMTNHYPVRHVHRPHQTNTLFSPIRKQILAYWSWILSDWALFLWVCQLRWFGQRNLLILLVLNVIHVLFSFSAFFSYILSAWGGIWLAEYQEVSEIKLRRINRKEKKTKTPQLNVEY